MTDKINLPREMECGGEAGALLHRETYCVPCQKTEVSHSKSHFLSCRFLHSSYPLVLLNVHFVVIYKIKIVLLLQTSIFKAQVL